MDLQESPEAASQYAWALHYTAFPVALPLANVTKADADAPSDADRAKGRPGWAQSRTPESPGLDRTAPGGVR